MAILTGHFWGSSLWFYCINGLYRIGFLWKTEAAKTAAQLQLCLLWDSLIRKVLKNSDFWHIKVVCRPHAWGSRFRFVTWEKRNGDTFGCSVNIVLMTPAAQRLLFSYPFISSFSSVWLGLQLNNSSITYLSKLISSSEWRIAYSVWSTTNRFVWLLLNVIQ